MKKHFLANWQEYLIDKNSHDGASGSGGDGAPAGAEGGQPPAGGSDQNPTGQQEAGPQEPSAQGQSPSDWKTSLPKEVLDNPRLQGIETVEALAQALIESNHGAPTIPEKMVLPEGVPEAIGQWGVEAGLTQEQFDKVLQQYNVVEDARLESIKQSNIAGEKALYEQWGEAKAENLNLANRVIAFADPEGKLKLAEYLHSKESGYAYNNPLVLQVFANIGKAWKEGGVLKGERVPDGSTKERIPKAHRKYPDQAPKK